MARRQVAEWLYITGKHFSIDKIYDKTKKGKEILQALNTIYRYNELSINYQ